MDAVHAAGEAFFIILDPFRMLILFSGAALGLVLGILPGIGGLAATALLLPFTYNMDSYAAFALLLGLGATVATGDPISAILFGVAGHAGSASTVLDGYPMTRRGEAGRALSASYMSSLLGGLFGAILMAVMLPVLRSVMLYIGSPEMLAFSVFGLSMVATLSGSAPLRGLIAAGVGLLISMVGADHQTGTLRWTFGTLYLWEGVPLVPVALGLFALPELADLAIGRRPVVATDVKLDTSVSGMILGAKDVFRNWWLVLRCSWIGTVLGALPGAGGPVVDWIAYGHAMRTCKGGRQTFGSGDVRGVIASEAPNNSREGGALIPLIAFGVPGSAGMAILLGAFLIQGLVPGPDMLTKHLALTYSMAWSIGFANIIGAGLCYLLSPQFAKLATLRYTLILPTVLSIMYIGAFQTSWGDLFVLLGFGILGWVMKQLKWPRPPLVLGVVLGSIVENYLFISIQRYGAAGFERPVVVVLFALAALTLVRPLLEDVKNHGGLRRMVSGFGRPVFARSQLFYVFFFSVVCFMMVATVPWPAAAKIVPLVVGGLTMLFAILSFTNQIFPRPLIANGADGTVALGKLHMDIASDHGHLSTRTILFRATMFFGWLVGFMCCMAIIGLIPTVPIFVILFMRLEGQEKWKLVLPQAIILTTAIYFAFDQMLALPWPPTLLGMLIPSLRGVVPSV